ncbi:MAG: peptidylprolyl isomerase [Polyangiaceae bacterium]
MELAPRIALDDVDDPPNTRRAAADPSPSRRGAPPKDEPARTKGPEPAPSPGGPESSTRALASRVLSNRLVQFSLIAAALFAIAPRAEAPSRVELHHEALDRLHGAAAAKSGRVALSNEDAAAVDRRAIEDEILFREGVRLGLDQADGVVRNRVIQKTLFFAEELGDASRPSTEAEQRAYFAEHAADFRRPARARIQHVFARSIDALPPKPADSDGTIGHPPALGEPGPVPSEITGDERALAEAFGEAAAKAIVALPEGAWSGPITSGFGAHYVKVLAREAARPMRFEEVRPRVVERLDMERREQAVAAFLSKAFARYDVTLDGAKVPSIADPHRTAIRGAVSGED